MSCGHFSDSSSSLLFLLAIAVRQIQWDVERVREDDLRIEFLFYSTSSSSFWKDQSFTSDFDCLSRNKNHLLPLESAMCPLLGLGLYLFFSSFFFFFVRFFSFSLSLFFPLTRAKLTFFSFLVPCVLFVTFFEFISYVFLALNLIGNSCSLGRVEERRVKSNCTTVFKFTF